MRKKIRKPEEKKINPFLKSEAWAKIRVDVFMLRNGICEYCNGKINKRFNVHHLTYKRYGGNEEPEDLMLLHQRCHQKIHDKLNAQKKRKKIKKVLAKKKKKKKNKPTVKAEPIKRYEDWEIREMQKNFEKVCPCCGKPR